MNSRHVISRAQQHFGWNHDIEPAIRIAPGDVVAFDTVDAGGGQITRQSGDADVARFNFTRVNPIFGPVYIDGAEPGDVLEITVRSLEIDNWGWTANIPGFGLLADRFTEPALHIWQLDPACARPAAYAAGGAVPLKPFPGILGNAPPQKGIHSVVNPRIYGGNMDTRDIGEGARLLLPVGVEGALFSCGDGHAAQGDGEICGTAIETPMKMVLGFDVIKGVALPSPRFTIAAPVTRHIDDKGYEVTMAMGPDLMDSARRAVSDMIDYLAEKEKMEPVDVYMLLSVCGDLRISEIVDAPDWVVCCYFPRRVLTP